MYTYLSNYFCYKNNDDLNVSTVSGHKQTILKHGFKCQKQEIVKYNIDCNISKIVLINENDAI